MRFKTTFVKLDGDDAIANSRAAVRKIRDDLAGISPSLVVFFAATVYDAETLAREMDSAFPGAVTMGCTSAGEACDKGMYENSVVAMAFSPEALSYCRTALVLADAGAASGTESDVFSTADEAMTHLGRGLPEKLLDLNHREYVGFMLGDKGSPFVESLVERIGEMTNVLFVGGIAGDDQKFLDMQRVFYRGRVYFGAAVLALWKPAHGFELLKTQAVEPTGKSMLVTEADEARRIIWKFDGEDAVPAYAHAIGVPLESMDITDFDQNPLAIMANGEPYVRSLKRKVDDKGLEMFAKVCEGTRQTLTRTGDVVATTGAALAEKRAQMGHIEAILHVNCTGRHMTLKKIGRTAAFSELFADTPSIAFSSFGEIYVGILTMTSTMILFK